MGYRGQVEKRVRARELRAEACTLAEIAAELQVAKSTVSLWVRDVPFVPRPRRSAAARRVHPAHAARVAAIARYAAEGAERIGALSERDLLVAGTALYAGEGAKGDGAVIFANTDPRMVALFLRYLRTFFPTRRDPLASADVSARGARPRRRATVLERGHGHPARTVLEALPGHALWWAPRHEARARLPGDPLLVPIHVAGDLGSLRRPAKLTFPFRGSSTGRASAC
jgi:hypothetical protein